jgi:predicted component of type VI protein secretion system
MTASALTKEVEFVIKNYEPRVSLEKVNVIGLPDYNSYQVTITFYIENLVQPFTADFILSRLR